MEKSDYNTSLKLLRLAFWLPLGGLAAACLNLFGSPFLILLLAVVLSIVCSYYCHKTAPPGCRGVRRLASLFEVVGCLFLFGTFLSMPLFHGGCRIAAQKAMCTNNLAQISKATAMYSSDQYYGVFPDPIERLYDSGRGICGDELVFLCPSRHRADAARPTSDYYLMSRLSQSTPANHIIALDLPGNHEDGGVAAYMDTHVKFVRTSDQEAYRQFFLALLWGNRKLVAKYVPECSNGTVGQK